MIIDELTTEEAYKRGVAAAKNAIDETFRLSQFPLPAIRSYRETGRANAGLAKYRGAREFRAYWLGYARGMHITI